MSYERDSLKPLDNITEESNENKTTRLKDELKCYLDRCESPFIWRPKEETKYASVSIPRLFNKNKEIKDDRQFRWRK